MLFDEIEDALTKIATGDVQRKLDQIEYSAQRAIAVLLSEEGAGDPFSAYPTEARISQASRAEILDKVIKSRRSRMASKILALAESP